MTEDTIPDADLHAIVAQLEEAGLVETYVNTDGKEVYRLTAQGESVGRALAKAGDDDAAAVLDALMDAEG